MRWAHIASIACLPLFATAAAAQDTIKPTVHNLHEIGNALAACMQPLPVADPYKGMQVTAKFGFNSQGQPLGPPQFTYVTPDAPARIKSEYEKAIADALTRCTPLSFSAELGRTIAGRPIILRFIERRGTKKAPPTTEASVVRSERLALRDEPRGNWTHT